MVSIATADESAGKGLLDIARSRKLLANLRAVMAGSGEARDRLNKIVQVIAAEQEVDVCSCYVMRAGQVLELFATVGLKQESVNRTRLQAGQGLVGTIALMAQPMALSQAHTHSNFVYRPETGEEAYSSLCGVPIIRGGRVRGVLVIQTRQKRDYTAVEIETLETVAMIVAELFANGDLVPDHEIVSGSDPALQTKRLEGIGLNGGLGIGTAVLHRNALPVRAVIAEDPVEEQQRLDDALDALKIAVDRLVDTARAAGLGEHRDIIETYRMFAHDRGWVTRLNEAIDQGLTAEAAVQRVQNENRLKLSGAPDGYLREKLLDFDDLANRLLSHLAGLSDERSPGLSQPNPIIVARSMGPAELLDYEAYRPSGLVLEEGSVTSHVAIIARALDIPVIGRCRGALTAIEALDQLVIDADTGAVFVRPGEDVVEAYQDAIKARAARREAYAELRGRPARTCDGRDIKLLINASLSIEINHLDETGASGVGLYRTEIPFMVRSAYPDVSAQTQLYRRALDSAGDKPVTFRTLDVGGDKRLPFFPEQQESNPAMGWRALRIGLDRPAMLRMQIRAMLRAAENRQLNLMFPLVAHAGEFEAARRMVDQEIARARCAGDSLPHDIRIGAMIEVPAVLWELDRLCAAADFISVGSNDLMQYLFAADRENPRLSQRYDALLPAVLRALSAIRIATDRAGIDASVCGEMAGNPLEAMALIGLGFDRLSMAPKSVGPVKAMLHSLDSCAIRDYLEQLLAAETYKIRPRLKAFAQDHGIAL